MGLCFHSSFWKPSATGYGRRSNQCWGRGRCLKPRERASCSRGIWFLGKRLLPVNHHPSSSFPLGNTHLHEHSGWSFLGYNHGELKIMSLSQCRNLGRTAPQPQSEAPAPEEAHGRCRAGAEAAAELSAIATSKRLGKGAGRCFWKGQLSPALLAFRCGRSKSSCSVIFGNFLT